MTRRPPAGRATTTESSRDRAIGRLEGKMDALIEADQQAAASRAKIYDALSDLKSKVEATERKVGNVEDRIKKVEEPVAEFSRWRERGVGALMLMSFVAASVGGAVVAFGKKLWAAIVG